MTLQDDIRQWFTKQLPKGWFEAPVDVLVDDDEILVTGTLGEPDVPKGTTDDTRSAARQSAIKRFREDTRSERIKVAEEAERLYGRKVSWAARCGDLEGQFTGLAVPVMTRLRLPERQLLDTLVDAGVARSRSEALAWCVRLVARHESDWLRDLEDALQAVRDVRHAGPAARRKAPKPD